MNRMYESHYMIFLVYILRIYLANLSAGIISR